MPQSHFKSLAVAEAVFLSPTTFINGIKFLTMIHWIFSKMIGAQTNLITAPSI